MNKPIRICLLIMVIGVGTSLHTWQETRSPLSLYEGYMHYQLDRDRELNEFNVDTHFWTGIYFRTAPNAYNDGCGDTTTPGDRCCPGRKESLATLYFGESTFTFEQAFNNAVIPAGSSVNPFAILSPITINVDYREQGVWFGTTISTRFGCNNQWSVGLRARVPFRDIKVEPLCGNPITNSATENNPASFVQQRQESIQVGESSTVTQNAFAARLDVLNVLNRIGYNVDGTTIPMVTYPASDILIAGQNASGGLPTAGPTSPVAPLLGIIESTDGSLPTSVRWADLPSNGAAVVNDDGSGLGNLQRGRIAQDVNYAALSGNVAAQSRLYVVPNVQGIGGESSPGSILNGANTVYSNITEALGELSGTSLADFVGQVGLNVCYGNTRGMGDTNFEFFFAHDWSDCGYLEGRLWFMAPTGLKVTDPLQILKFPTGNNGHPEVGLGIAGGINTLRYLAFSFDALYSWVVPSTNFIAAPFEGALVKNIGPCVGGKTSWQYGIINCNVNVINPFYECMGVMFGYQAFIKSSDKLCLFQKTAVDWAGNIKPLDPAVYTKNSDRIAHKIRTETFFAGACMNTFLGFTATIAGKNIPSEVDFHIGLDVYF